VLRLQDADNYDPAARAAEESELSHLIAKIDTKALSARASFLRQGVQCSVPALGYDRATRSSVMGGMNYHIELCFEDGVKWITRIRRFNATSPPSSLRDYIVRSEVATLKFLEQTNVPAPKVFDYAFEHDPDNRIGVGYILMEKLPGKSMRWALATKEQRRNLMDQLADIFIELHKHPLNSLGSLDSPDTPQHIGGFARESLTDFTPSGEMLLAGPCPSIEEYHKYSLRFILELILREEMYTQQPVDAYLVHRFLFDLIPSIVSSKSQSDQKNYYLKHADDKGDHILVDEGFNITGIIDWEWAHTMPPEIAFNSPIGLLPVADFYDGVNDIGEDEVVFARLLEDKGCPELAAHIRKGRLQHRFAFCCGYDLAGDWSGFLGLFRGLREAVQVDQGMDWDEWKKVALSRYSEDEGLKLICS
jgi:hypothetical protein